VVAETVRCDGLRLRTDPIDHRLCWMSQIVQDHERDEGGVLGFNGPSNASLTVVSTFRQSCNAESADTLETPAFQEGWHFKRKFSSHRTPHLPIHDRRVKYQVRVFW